MGNHTSPTGDAPSDSSPYLFSNAIWNSLHLCCANKTFVRPGFPGSSAGKKSTCNAEDPSSIPGWGRSPGEGIDYPLQYSWASLMAQIVENLPAMWETWVRGGTPHTWRRVWQATPVFPRGESPWTEEPGGLQSKELDTTEQWSTHGCPQGGKQPRAGLWACEQERQFQLIHERSYRSCSQCSESK